MLIPLLICQNAHGITRESNLFVDEARSLYKNGLYEGTSSTKFNPDLQSNIS